MEWIVHLLVQPDLAKIDDPATQVGRVQESVFTRQILTNRCAMAAVVEGVLRSDVHIFGDAAKEASLESAHLELKQVELVSIINVTIYSWCGYWLGVTLCLKSEDPL